MTKNDALQKIWEIIEVSDLEDDDEKLRQIAAVLLEVEYKT